MYTTLLVIHILAAGAWFGTNVVQFVVNPRVRTYPADIGSWWLRRTVAFGTRIYTPAAVVLLVTGVFLVIDNDLFEFSSTFVTIGFTMVIIGAGLGMFVFGPRGEAAASAIEAGNEPEVRRLTGSLAGFGVLDSVLLVVTIIAMTSKWGA